MSVTNELNPDVKILMGPGPSDVHPLVLKAMATPLIGHLDPQFIEIMDNVMEMLRKLFRTKNQLTFAVSATGSAGMETCFANLLEPGDEALVCVHGVFGSRMSDIVERCGAKLIRIDAPWGEPIDPSAVKKALESCKPKLVAIVHAETSTGVRQPLEDISQITHDAGALFLVDTVTSLGGIDVRVDDHAEPFKELGRILKIAQMNYAWNEAWTLFTQKKFAEALPPMERTAELAPDYGEVFYDLACIRLANGDRPGALEALEKALSLNPKLVGQAIRDDDLSDLHGDGTFEKLTGDSGNPILGKGIEIGPAQ